MRLRPPLLVALAALTFPACDAVEPDPPSVEPPPIEPPPSLPVHPYGEGNGKVMFVSDLAIAGRIDVTLAGEPVGAVGAVTKFVGCPGRVVTDDSLATAVRPAGRYQYSARSTTGTTWATSTVQIDEDGLRRVTFIGSPSQYAGHLPNEIEGVPVTRAGEDRFHLTARGAPALDLRVSRPAAVEGDRMDVVVNGAVVARGVALATEDLSFAVPLNPGPNYVAVRLSVDVGGNGSPSLAALYENGSRVGYVNDYSYNYPGSLVVRAWAGLNVRYSC